MPETPLAPISPLRGLLEVTRLLRAREDVPSLLTALSRTIGESLGYRTVAINLYRPEWNDFCVTTVYGNEDARRALEGRVRSGDDWAVLLHDRFARRGAYAILSGAIDWDELGASYIPEVAAPEDPDAWHPEDALFVPLRHTEGHLLGIISVDEPASGLRPTDEVLDVLVALGDHAALALQAAQEEAEAARHRRALEALLSISSQLTSEPDADEILRLVCEGIRDALGFKNVCGALVEPGERRVVARAAVGWSLDHPALRQELHVGDVEALLDRRFRREGCYLLPHEEAARRLGETRIPYASELNGRGPWAWNRHWLLVPLRDGDGGLLGLIWVDDPCDRLLPSADKLQALRIFANDAAAALVSGRRVDELRFLADHDPLTRLLNRRAFVEQLDGEVARAVRYGRSFGLVLADLDGFKQLNDRFGHAIGDEALQVFAGVLARALRKPDDAFRIGGDEFALLLAEASEADTRTVVRRVQRLLSENADPRLSAVTVSFGCAACPVDASESQTLFRLADEALYEAKRSGCGLHFVA
ncbi:MAG TPA: sensor domain-containing diguanylate cyclase [Gaiellaceae bacterium]|nr:sensor domain-containing diguanylate cyclase [Gaiellaceae bacterium]